MGCLAEKDGKFMQNSISIGKQNFADIRENGYFYIDKTAFIKEWWSSGDDVTLITRPRRFGKTLNMSTLDCFFSNQYAGRGDLFEELSVWEDDRYRRLQGTYPVISLSFADVKQADCEETIWKIKKIIANVYQQYVWLGSWEGLSSAEREQFAGVLPDMKNTVAQSAIQDLCNYLSRYYKRKVIILLDEYDTPMQEAYINDYWDEFTAFIRGFFNATFKTNPYLERAVMTGITRVSKESIFSDLNNLTVVTTTSDRYSTAFGFTEVEVFKALDDMGLGECKADVKRWYDGFIFGQHRDIYNPWSITNFLKEKKLRPYWASTSSNGLVSKLIQTASSEIKQLMEDLISGRQIVVSFDEQIVFNQLEVDESAVWSLLVASGYLKVNKIEYYGELLEPWYHLSITNLETRSMFSNMFKGWFKMTTSNYNAFVTALLKGHLREMNVYMNDVALSTFSSFDAGTQPSERAQPERFYHGFVLGLLVELRDIYEVRSNRESGYGRYDVMLIPKDDGSKYKAIILEFKVFDSYEESTLEDTAKSAIKQIEEKNYDAELIARGIKKENIRHYGFAFEGKKVLIVE